MSPVGDRTADYDFELPPDRIAQHPLAKRDDSRLMIVDRATQRITHSQFSELATIIPGGDAIVLNTSRVIKARLLGTRESGARAEVLLLNPEANGSWQALVRPGAKLKPGRRIRLGADVSIVVGEVLTDGARSVRFDTALSVDAVLETYGHIPLPPYIDRADTPLDAERYQTVYAREAGSVAAPTAGLHFTEALLATLAAKGVNRADVVLRVGAGTFKPVDVADPALHTMHREAFSMDAAAATTLNATRDRGARIWAVGTTSLRVLESVVGANVRFVPHTGETNIFIRPPHVVRGADCLITNFHLPRSTLMMLVSAFAGYELTRRAYGVAIAEGYRFFSYGDAMCIV